MLRTIAAPAAERTFHKKTPEEMQLRAEFSKNVTAGCLIQDYEKEQGRFRSPTARVGGFKQ